MHCVCCDRMLNDFESTRLDKHGEYMDMCNKCISETFITTSKEREDLNPDDVPDAELEPIFDEGYDSVFDEDDMEDWED